MNNRGIMNVFSNCFRIIFHIYFIIIPHIEIKMHSASSRFNGITLYTAMVLAIMCAVNFFHGYYIYEPKVDVNFEIKSLVNFVGTPQWDQASFKYSLNAGILIDIKICLPCIHGISNNCLCILSSSGMIPKQTYFETYKVNKQNYYQ